MKKVFGTIVPLFFSFFLKKKKAGGVTTFFVFGDTSHLFNLYLYYNSVYMPMQAKVDSL